jgi:hypothetical protein
MDVDRRHADRRGPFDRREQASAQIDVTRIEHENLYNQVMENVRALRRIETELARIRSLLEQSHRDRTKTPA